MRMRRWAVWLPLVVVVALLWCLLWSLRQDPRVVPSTLIGKPLPMVAMHHWPHEVWLLHVMASWCVACQSEHATWMARHRRYNVPIIALDYKEPAVRIHVWLKKHGNPYQQVWMDPRGDVAIEWGVYGAPETFVIDAQGVVRARYVGAISQQQWQREVWPLVVRWRGGS